MARVVSVLEEQEPLLEADDPGVQPATEGRAAPPSGSAASAQPASCRICLQEETDGLVKPCNCSGSMAVRNCCSAATRSASHAMLQRLCAASSSRL
jgi:hypothetical protein